MKSLITIIKLDYLQRTRNYNFIITLCASLAIAYTFVPEPNANYSTIRIGGYVGFYNSAWFGYVTAIMTSLFLSLVGYYLVNGGIKNDRNNKVGQIIATTSISNVKYLLVKMMSNFLLLASITLAVFLMSVALFFVYNDGYTFELYQFVKPYLLITFPSLFFIAALAIIFETIFKKYSILQNIVFFFAFSSLLASTPKKERFYLDVFGTNIVMHQIEEEVKTITNSNETKSMNIGYVIGNTKQSKKFEFAGMEFASTFILSRLFWMILGFCLILVSSLIFQRFSSKSIKRVKSKRVKAIKNKLRNDINISELVATTTNYSIFPLLKFEFLLLVRKGKKWLWFLNISGMLLLGFLPLEQAHQIVLPILWFLQVHRISDIATKEISSNTQLFANVSYKPIKRIFASKIMATFLLLLIISSPLIVKYLINFNWIHALSIILGFSFLILVSSLFGLITKGKKLFEIVFFLITYANINGIAYVDYFGGFSSSLTKINIFICLILLFLALSVLLKKKSLQV